MNQIKRLSAIILVVLTILTTFVVVPASAATSGNYTYTTSGSSAIITKFNSSYKGSVSIPSKIGKYSVTEIGENAFKYCDYITSVKIPSSVKKIGNYAFASCYKLKKVTISSGVTEFGEFAFAFNDALVSISFPSTLKTIGENAFYGCDGLKSITIPAKVSSIGDYAFSNCKALTKISVSSSNKYYSGKSGVLFNKDKSLLIESPAGKTGTYTVPSTVKEIKDYAFSYSKISGIIFPSSLTEIPSNVCYSCDKLTSITIPSSVKSIGSWAFSSCKALKKISIPASVELIGNEYSYPYTVFFNSNALTSISVSSSNKNYYSKDGVLFSKDKETLYICPAAKSGTYTVPSTVKTIANSAFQYCEKLTKITLPTALEIIEGSAFYGCDKLTSITIPENVISFSSSSFVAEQLAKVNVSSKNQMFTSIDGVVFSKDKKTLLFYPVYKKGAYTIPDGTTDIGEYAFTYNTLLTRLYFPDTIETIGDGAFGYQGYKEKLVHVYYDGSKTEWNNNVVVGEYSNDRLNKAKFHSNAIKSKTPTLVSAKNTSSGIKVTWKKTSDTEGYYLYRKTGSGSWKKIKTITSSSTVSYTDKNVKKGTTYKYTVRAYHGDYISKYNTSGVSRKRS